jgi:glycosyltransferase involved in cell wall biosynthesis
MNNKGLLGDLPKSLNSGWPWNTEVLPNTYDETIEYPKISIVTPSYNQGQYIEETIRSILLQNYPNLEYIIIDGGSTDETVEVVKKYEKWISYWISEPDNGQSHAINKGLTKCTGTVFNWLNSDDYYTPDALKTVGANFFKTGCYSLIGYVKNFSSLNDDSENISALNLVYRTRVRSIEETVAFANLVQPGTFFDLETIKTLGGVNEECHYMMDAELWLKFLFTYGIKKVDKVDDVLVNFRFHADSKTVSQNRNQNLELLFLLTKAAKKASLPNSIITELQALTNYGLSIKDTLNVSNQIILDKNKLTSYIFYAASAKLFVEGNFANARKCLKHVDFSYLNSKKRCKVIQMYFGRVGLTLRKALKLINI